MLAFLQVEWRAMEKGIPIVELEVVVLACVDVVLIPELRDMLLVLVDVPLVLEDDILWVLDVDETSLVVVVGEAVLVLVVDRPPLVLVEVEELLALLPVTVLGSLVELSADDAVWEDSMVEDIDGFAVGSDIGVVMDVCVDDFLVAISKLVDSVIMPVLLPVSLRVLVLCEVLVVNKVPEDSEGNAVELVVCV